LTIVCSGQGHAVSKIGEAASIPLADESAYPALKVQTKILATLWMTTLLKATVSDAQLRTFDPHSMNWWSSWFITARILQLAKVP
jgi:hypothetical protein